MKITNLKKFMIEEGVNAIDKIVMESSSMFYYSIEAQTEMKFNAIKKAFEIQLRGEGFAMVEVLSTCPTNWGKTPIQAVKWLEDNMIPQFPLGVYKNEGGEQK